MMDFIIRPRAGGKTTTILDMMAKDKDLVLVVHNESERQRLARELAHLINKTVADAATRIVTYTTTPKLRGQAGRKKLVVDNIDLWIQSQLGPLPVVIVTGTGEVK